MQNTTTNSAPPPTLALTIRPLGKAEIEETVKNALADLLDVHTAADIYLALKQQEYAIQQAIEHTKEMAFESIGAELGGLATGTLHGHKVAISYPETWWFSAAHAELKRQQALDLKAMEAAEKAAGIATREQGKGRLAVTLHD